MTKASEVEISSVRNKTNCHKEILTARTTKTKEIVDVFDDISMEIPLEGRDVFCNPNVENFSFTRDDCMQALNMID